MEVQRDRETISTWELAGEWSFTSMRANMSNKGKARGTIDSIELASFPHALVR